jgi:LemA protein
MIVTALPLSQTGFSRQWVRILALLGLATILAGCGVNAVPTLEEKAKAAWSEVQNQYQRRADLIPNLVETVKGFAQQERDVLTGVIEARAKATQVKVDASTITDPAKFKEYQDAQNALTGALGRLLVTVERYPDLKSNANFLALQSQLEGTENRIAVARRDYIEGVRLFNTEIRTFPGVIWAKLFWGAKAMESFGATAGADKPPAVKF